MIRPTTGTRHMDDRDWLAERFETNRSRLRRNDRHPSAALATPPMILASSCGLDHMGQ
jgi:hypothetical protein